MKLREVVLRRDAEVAFQRYELPESVLDELYGSRSELPCRQAHQVFLEQVKKWKGDITLLLPKTTLFPSHFGEKCLLFLLPASRQKEIIGDLFEHFDRIATKHGTAFATSWYWWQTLRLAFGYVMPRMVGLTAAYNMLRRLLG